ncbi:hypothetical protein SHKM778_92170 [Streptomyces sp. KM77-8]|uniref:Copper resistance protein D domain-containing protein n=1 Tax=Streptomyces haneummycinicus TaxID=3074435 RepID=A0AAT9I039_9ACTN
MLHLLAMACWLGGLTALLLTLHRATTPPPLATVTRFSRLAFASVTVLVVTGVYQSWRGLGSWKALLETTYGQTLTVKLAATFFLLLAAAMSRRWTALLARPATVRAEARERVPALVGAPGTPSVTGTVPAAPDATVDRDGPDATVDPDGPDAAEDRNGRNAPEDRDGSDASEDRHGPDTPEDRHRRALRRSVLAEVVVAVLVLLVTTVLTGTLPARAEAEAAKAPEPQVAGLPGAEAFTIPYDAGTPAAGAPSSSRWTRAGSARTASRRWSSTPRRAELRPGTPYLLHPRGEGHRPHRREAHRPGRLLGHQRPQPPLEGTWTMKMTIRVSEVDQVSETRQVRITR